MVLLIGYGNPGRGDDGLGPALAERIRQRGMPDLVVKTDYQLKVEDALDVATSGTVIFADAMTGTSKPFDFSRVRPDVSADVGSHALSPGAVLALATLLFGAAPRAFTLGISGVDFDRIEEGLSDRAKTNLDLACDFLVTWLSDAREMPAESLAQEVQAARQ